MVSKSSAREAVDRVLVLSRIDELVCMCAVYGAIVRGKRHICNESRQGWSVSVMNHDHGINESGKKSLRERV